MRGSNSSENRRRIYHFNRAMTSNENSNDPWLQINILQQNDLSITKDLLSSSEKPKDDKNNTLLTSKIEFIQSPKRFRCPSF